MPQEFYYPVSTAQVSIPAGHDDYTLTGANKNAAMRPGGGRAGPMTHDDDGTYNGMTMNGTQEQAANGDWPGPIGIISALTMGMRDKVSSESNTRNCNFINASGTKGTTVATGSGGAGYNNTGPNDAMSARPGGGTWAAVDFENSTTFFMEHHYTGGSGAPFLWCTSLWGEMTYSPPSGGFVFLLGLTGALALPHVGRFPDFLSFRRYLDWRTIYHPRHTKWSTGEDLVAWRDIRAYRYPTHFLPA